MEVALRRGPFPAPGRRDPRVAPRRAGHGPAHGLRILGGEVAGNGEEPRVPRRIHDGKLAHLQPVALVRLDLVHHVDDGPATGDQYALLISEERRVGKECVSTFRLWGWQFPK